MPCVCPPLGVLPGDRGWVEPPAEASTERELKQENVGAENGTKRGRWASGSSSPPQLPGLALPAVWFHSQGLLKPSPMATLQNHGSCSHTHTFMGKEGVLNAKRPESPRASPKPTLTHPSLTRTHF